MACSFAVSSFVWTSPCCSLAQDLILLDLPNRKVELLFFSDSRLELLESLQGRKISDYSFKYYDAAHVQLQ